MGILIDATVLIESERGRFDMRAFLEETGDDGVAIAAITASELLFGCERARDAAIRARRTAYVEGLLDTLPVIPFGLAEARRHARIWAHLADRDTPIGPRDSLLAATALASGFSGRRATWGSSRGSPVSASFRSIVSGRPSPRQARQPKKQEAVAERRLPVLAVREPRLSARHLTRLHQREPLERPQLRVSTMRAARSTYMTEVWAGRDTAPQAALDRARDLAPTSPVPVFFQLANVLHGAGDPVLAPEAIDAQGAWRWDFGGLPPTCGEG